MNFINLVFTVISFLFLCSTQAREYKLNQIGFVPTALKKENQIEILSHNLKDNKLEVQMSECRVRAPDMLKRGKVLSYTSFIKPLNEGEKIEMLINGVRVTGDKSNPIYFRMTESCTKILPISFKSSINQEYRGVQINKDVEVKTHIIDSERDVMWGPIGEDGYYGEWSSKSAKKSLGDDIEGCARVDGPSEKSFYIYKGRKIYLDKADPKF